MTERIKREKVLKHITPRATHNLDFSYVWLMLNFCEVLFLTQLLFQGNKQHEKSFTMYLLCILCSCSLTLIPNLLLFDTIVYM